VKQEMKTQVTNENPEIPITNLKNTAEKRIRVIKWGYGGKKER
jgi:hypothetical protein